MKVKPATTSGRVLIEMGDKDEELLSPKVPTPFKLNRVLVPIDFSECSKKALRYAVAFAKQFDAEIDLVYVVNVNFPGTEFAAIDYAELQSQMVSGAASQLEDLVLAEVGHVVPVARTVRIGRPALEIVEAARQLDSDLIIMSTHGHSGLKHLFLGSTTENVVRTAKCPVLVVRENEHEFLAA